MKNVKTKLPSVPFSITRRDVASNQISYSVYAPNHRPSLVGASQGLQWSRPLVWDHWGTGLAPTTEGMSPQPCTMNAYTCAIFIRAVCCSAINTFHSDVHVWCINTILETASFFTSRFVVKSYDRMLNKNYQEFFWFINNRLSIGIIMIKVYITWKLLVNLAPTYISL